MTAAEIAIILTAVGGGAGFKAVVDAIRTGVPHKRQGVESEAIQSIIADRNRAIEERNRAVESEREAWARADSMEQRYDKMTVSRNKWRDRSARVDAWVTKHLNTSPETYPDQIKDDD